MQNVTSKLQIVLSPEMGWYPVSFTIIVNKDVWMCTPGRCSWASFKDCLRPLRFSLHSHGVLRVFCSDGFPYLTLLLFPPLLSTPAFSTPAFSTPAFSAPPNQVSMTYSTGFLSHHRKYLSHHLCKLLTCSHQICTVRAINMNALNDRVIISKSQWSKCNYSCIKFWVNQGGTNRNCYTQRIAILQSQT